MFSFWVWGGRKQEEEAAINTQASAQICAVLLGRNCSLSPVFGEGMRDLVREETYRSYVGNLAGALFWDVAQDHFTCPFSHQSYING